MSSSSSSTGTTKVDQGKAERVLPPHKKMRLRNKLRDQVIDLFKEESGDTRDQTLFFKRETATNDKEKQTLFAKHNELKKRRDEIQVLEGFLSKGVQKLADADGLDEETSVEVARLHKCIDNHKKEVDLLTKRRVATIQVTTETAIEELTISLHTRVVEAKEEVEICMRSPENDTCAICTNRLIKPCMTTCKTSLEPEKCYVSRGGCSHEYHTHCIMNWLKRHTTCPLDDELWEFEVDDTERESEPETATETGLV